MHIDAIDYSLPYTSRYKSGMIIPGGVNICNSTSNAEYYKVTSIINISCPEHIETAWIARELHDGGGFEIRWAVEPVTYENTYSIGDRVIDDTTKKTFEVIAYRRATFGDKYISSLNKTTILTGSTSTERWIVAEVCDYTIQTCTTIWDESTHGYTSVPEFQVRVYNREAIAGSYAIHPPTGFVAVSDWSYPAWKYCEFVTGVNPLEEQKKQKAWSYETAFKLGDVVEDTSNNKNYTGKFCIAGYRIPQANEYYISRWFTTETSTYINHTGPHDFHEDSLSYWILEKVFDYETEFKIGDVITDKKGDKYVVSAYRKAGIHELYISRFHSIPELFKAAGFTNTAYWIVEPVETNPYLECTPVELWLHIRSLESGDVFSDRYKKVQAAFLERCK